MGHRTNTSRFLAALGMTILEKELEAGANFTSAAEAACFWLVSGLFRHD